jgi:hypothetical protein
MGVLWPGITVRRPAPAEVFGSDEEVLLEMELLDHSETDVRSRHTRQTEICTTVPKIVPTDPKLCTT